MNKIEEKAEKYRQEYVVDHYDPTYTSYTGKEGYIAGYKEAIQEVTDILEKLYEREAIHFSYRVDYCIALTEAKEQITKQLLDE